MLKSPPRPIIKDAEGLEVAAEIMVEEIKQIAEAFQRLDRSKLQKRVILLLIRDETNLNLGDIARVLKAASELSKTFIKA